MIPLLLTVAVLAQAPLKPMAYVPRDGLELLRESMQRADNQVKVGQWVTYRFSAPDRKPKFWRFAAVAEEKDKLGRDAVWYEMEAGEHSEFRAPLLQMKMLLAKESGFSKAGMTRLIVQVGASKPQEVSDDMIAQVISPENEPSRDNPTVPIPKDPSLLPKTKALPRTSLMTLAGTVSATPVEISVRNTPIKRMWVSEQIPLLHLAKLELPGLDYSVEVRDYGINAKPRMLKPPPELPKIKVGDLEKYLGELQKKVPEQMLDEEEADDAPEQSTP